MFRHLLPRTTTPSAIRQRRCPASVLQFPTSTREHKLLPCGESSGVCCSVHYCNVGSRGSSSDCQLVPSRVATARALSSGKTGLTQSPPPRKQWLVELLCSDADFQSVWEENLPTFSTSSDSCGPALLQNLDDVPLDRESRYLIDLLDDAYHGIRRGTDVATTARCNKMIQKLSDMSRGGKVLKGRAQRADAILQRMERFQHLPTSLAMEDAPTFAPKLPARKRALPLPNNDTYFFVLRLYATPPVVRGGGGSGGGATMVSPQVPRRAEAMVETMNRLYHQEGQLEMKPSTVAWNQVLACWAVSSDTDKAYHAASLLKRWQDKADASSYSHVFRACALSEIGNGNERAREVGFAVAQRMWNEMEKRHDQVEMTSFTITFFLRAMGRKNEFPDPTRRQQKEGKQRDDYIKQAFQRCQEKGLVNAHVLFELERVASPSLLQHLLGPDLAAFLRQAEQSGSGGGGGGEKMTLLLRKVPSSWKRNANQKSEWGW